MVREGSDGLRDGVESTQRVSFAAVCAAVSAPPDGSGCGHRKLIIIGIDAALIL